MIFNKSHYMFKHKRCIIDEVIQILDNSLPKYLLRIYTMEASKRDSELRLMWVSRKMRNLKLTENFVINFTSHEVYMLFHKMHLTWEKKLKLLEMNFTWKSCNKQTPGVTSFSDYSEIKMLQHQILKNLNFCKGN